MPTDYRNARDPHHKDRRVQTIWGHYLAPAVPIIVGAVGLILVAPKYWASNPALGWAILLVSALLLIAGVVYYAVVRRMRRRG